MRLTTFLLLGTGLSAQAQTLSVAEVYDFQPGDVFQTRNSATGPGPGGPPGYVTGLVQQRYYGPDLDSLFYVVERTVYQPPTLEDPPLLVTTIDTLVYTDLDAPAAHYALPYPCHPPLYSLGNAAAYCGRETWTAYTYNDTCFEPDMWTSELVRGCGGPYFWSFQPVGPLTLRRELIYFRKGAEECGTWITNISEVLRPRPLVVWPNPATDQVDVRGAIAGDRLRACDGLGRLVLEQAASTSVDLRTLASGTYAIELWRSGTVCARGTLFKQ